jgi:D-3-phosphoglycerate dehydrogenase / 2-oxoglutarate reductase
MMQRKDRVVLVSEIAGLGREHLRPLEQRFELVERYELDSIHDEQVLVDGLDGAWAVVAGSETYTDALLTRLPDLRIIARCGVGIDAIDLAAATAHAVAVSITPDANSDGVADLAVGLMLVCLRRILAGDHSARTGAWRPEGLSGDLGNATVGVVGLGRVGQKMVRRLGGFDCRLLAFETHPDRDFCRDHGVTLVELATLLSEVDVLSVHVPLTPSTRRLIGARELALMKPSAILVNTSRGGVIDERALIAALSQNQLAGAGLDVYEHEPLTADHPLTTLDNVVLSPHAASFSRQTAAKILNSVSTSITDAAAGRLPFGCMNPDAWTSPN